MTGDQQERTVTITLRQYMRLYKADCTLNALESIGVDNWGGYDELDRTWISDTCRTERTRIINGEAPNP